MLKSIGVQNFKSFKSSQILELENLTLLTGLNGSGKSSFYQIISLLAQSEDSTARLSKDHKSIPILDVNGHLVKIGKKEELLFDAENRTADFSFLWEDRTENKMSFTLLNKHGSSVHSEFFLSRFYFSRPIEDGLRFYDVYRTDAKWSVKGRRIFEFDNIAFGRILDKHIRSKLTEESGDLIYLSNVEFDDIKELSFIKFELFAFSISFEQVVNCVSEKFRSLINLDELKDECKKQDVSVDEIRLRVGDKLSNVYYLSENYISNLMPFRGYPQRVYSEGIHTNPLHSLVHQADDKIAYRYDFEKNKAVSGTVKQALEYWICSFFKFSEGIEVNPLVADYATEVFLSFGEKKVPINNSGFGISQILPVIYEILSARRKILFVVDEPEIHLHPSAQSKLARFFFEMSLVGKNILVETHSENLLNAIIFHLIKYDHKAKNTLLYWIKRDSNGSKVERIQFDDLGYIVNSPESFMDEHSKMVEELSKLRLEKIKKSHD